MLAATVKAMSDQELSELSRDVAREIAQRGGRVADGALSIAVAALQSIAQHGSEERDLVTAQAALDCIEALGQRVTHGRHCTCGACAREDWTRITAPCGMHGEGCPAVYAPLSAVREQEA